MRSSIRETVPIISVVTPVYNSEKYLDEAIQSVLSQTFTEWELLLINDGSTDGSGELCDRYLNLDKRIRVFHIENGGYGRARNLGLDNAVGEWITFLDSDDYLAPCALQHMLDHAYDSDIVMSLYQTIPEQTMTKQTMIRNYRKYSAAESYILGFENEGLSSSVHGGAKWYQMRLTFNEDYFYEHLFMVSDNPLENMKMLEETLWGHPM